MDDRNKIKINFKQYREKMFTTFYKIDKIKKNHNNRDTNLKKILQIENLFSFLNYIV